MGRKEMICSVTSSGNTSTESTYEDKFGVRTFDSLGGDADAQEYK
jgi:hypothetical protein